MSASGSPWQDRRGLFQKGREIHEPAPPRRMSQGSVTDALARTTSNTSAASASTASPGSPTIQQRRRSSASSQAGLFGNLMSQKRGSQDYGQRRSSIEEMTGKSGFLGGVWGSAVRGVEKTKDATMDAAKEAKRGVME